MADPAGAPVPGAAVGHLPVPIPLPAGWRLRLADGVRVVDGGRRLIGGAPLRALTLSPRGASLLSSWLAGQPVGEGGGAGDRGVVRGESAGDRSGDGARDRGVVRGESAGGRGERALARRLLDAGLVHPDPPARPPEAIREVTVVVPVYADPDRLRACLAPLPPEIPVIVVDDGSPDGEAVATVAHEFGVRYVRHAENRGASAARNTGIRMAGTPFVAFLDADCVPPPAGFPARLLDHLADPGVGLAAPRIVCGTRGAGRIARYEQVRSALDMGPRPSLVRPYSTVWYVPSAAMVARRDALGAGFDEALHLGEDVDLVWRLHDAGWQVRYDPTVSVAHEDRVRPVEWYRRRVAYNESVAPLLERHPERVPVLFLSPVAAAAWVAALGGAVAPVVLLAGLRAVRLRRALAGRLPGAGTWAARASLETTLREARDLARALNGPWAPFALAALAVTRGPRRRGLAVRLAALVAGMAIADYLTDRPALDPVSYADPRALDPGSCADSRALDPGSCADARALDPLSYAALRVADESSRGVGIWLGCLRARDFRALLPRRPPPPSRR